MIKIIERHEPDEPNYRFTCSKCHSIAEITDNEVKCAGVQWDSYYEFKCPVCSKAYWDATQFKVLCMEEFEKLGE